MKKIVVVALIFCAGVYAGCGKRRENKTPVPPAPLAGAGGGMHLIQAADFERVVLEAEAAREVTPEFLVGEDAEASGGKCVWIPDKVNPKEAPPESRKGRVSIDFAAAKGGRYAVWLRRKWLDGCGNSVSVAVDTAERSESVLAEDGTYGRWGWLEVAHLSSAVAEKLGKDPHGFDLAAGKHTLYLFNNEDGIWIDQILVVEFPEGRERYIPEGIEKP